MRNVSIIERVNEFRLDLLCRGELIIKHLFTTTECTQINIGVYGYIIIKNVCRVQISIANYIYTDIICGNICDIRM